MFVLLNESGNAIASSEEGIRYINNTAVFGIKKPTTYAEFNESNSSVVERDYFDLDDLKEKCYEELEKKLTEKWLVIKNGYTTYEADTFAFQVEEAKAYQADNNAETPFIDAAMGETSKSDYCALVIANNVPYRQAGGAVVNLRRTLEEMINDASTESEYIETIEVIKNA